MILSVARLATIRTAERTLSSGILAHPTDSLYGKILYIIDIPLPLVVSEVVEKTILDTLRQEYFDVERKTAVYQFEDALKQLNASLAELAENGQSDWVGHVHACIVLWADNELFVTHTGRILGIVVRGESLVSLVDPSPYDRRVMIHKTFSNLTSGQLVPKDVVILGNGEMSRHFSPQFLSQTAQLSPFKAVQSMFSTAGRLNLRFITAIVGRVEDEDDEFASSDTPTVLLEPHQRSGSLTKERTRAAWLARAQSYIRQIQWKPYWDTILQTVRNVVALATPKIKKGVQTTVQTLQSPQKQAVQFEDEEMSMGESASPASVVPSHPLSSPQYIRSSSQKINHIISKSNRKLGRQYEMLKKMVSGLSPRLLLISSALLLVVVIGSVSLRARSGTASKAVPSQESTQKLQEVRSLLQKATDFSEREPDQARTALQQANTLLTPLLQDTRNKEAVDETLRDLQMLLAKLNNIVYLDAKSDDSVASNTTNIVVIGQYLFSIQSKSSNLYRQTLGKKDKPESIYTVPNSTLTHLVFIEESRQLLLVTANQKIFRVSIDGNTSGVELTPPENQSWPETTSITTYENNLYLLEKDTGQIWKYTARDATSYNPKQSYLASASLAKQDTVAIVSDGYMYVLYADGTVAKLLKGAPQSFGPLTVPKPDSSLKPHALFASASATSVFIQDEKRLIELNKDGQYTRQFVLKEGTISYSFVSPKSKRAWLLVGNSLIETSL